MKISKSSLHSNNREFYYHFIFQFFLYEKSLFTLLECVRYHCLLTNSNLILISFAFWFLNTFVLFQLHFKTLKHLLLLPFLALWPKFYLKLTNRQHLFPKTSPTLLAAFQSSYLASNSFQSLTVAHEATQRHACLHVTRSAISLQACF